MLLARQTIPAAVLDPALRLPGAAEATYDVLVRDGRIESIVPAAERGRGAGLLLPGWWMRTSTWTRPRPSAPPRGRLPA